MYDSYHTETDKALEAVTRLIRSQGGKFTPNSLEMNIEFVAYSKEQQKTNWWASGYGGGTSTVNQSNAIYYDMIDETVFLKKKGRYEVRIMSQTSKSGKTFSAGIRILLK